LIAQSTSHFGNYRVGVPARARRSSAKFAAGAGRASLRLFAWISILNQRRPFVTITEWPDGPAIINPASRLPATGAGAGLRGFTINATNA
jgi:hypothetical protein